ncbi:MAG: hypothetical protein E7266_06350 [Lachnospiraceae bacterium]|nr:hypothetical protein [Lachnospiraceae bacterium]
MKNRLKLFNFGLYKEGLRLTKDITLTFMFILTMISVLLPLGIAAVLMEQGENMERITVGNLNFIYMYLIFLIVAPILVIMLFHFLSKRRSCDVFDSFPQRRETIFFSFMCSIATWLLLITLETFTVSSTMYAMLGKYFIYDYDGFFMALRYCLSIFICSLLVAAGFAFAYACNGTVITTIATAFAVLIVPRLIINAPLICVWIFSDFLAVRPTIPLFDHNTNLLYASIFSPNEYFISAGSIIYTLILFVVLFVLGIVSFKKRKSDTAGRCGANRLVIAFTQIGLTIALTIPMLFYCRFFLFAISGEIWFLSVVGIFLFFCLISFLQNEAFAFGIMIGYEAIASRGLKKFINFVWIIPVFIAVQVFMITFTFGVEAFENNLQIPSKYVTSVTITDASYHREPIFAEHQDKELTDPEVIEAITKILEDNIEHLDNEDYYNELGLYDMSVEIKAGPITLYRNLQLTGFNYQDLENAFNKY